MRVPLSLIPLAISGASAIPRAAQLEARDDVDAKGSYVPTTAPHENIFAGISFDEMESVYDFLRNQPADVISEDLYFDYDRGYWLLPPNKTAATAYLDGKGPKPPRYARAMGDAGCFRQEWMVGPLPISDKTKAMPLAYVNHGESVSDNGNCARRGNSSETPQEARLRDAANERQNGTNSRLMSPHMPYEEEMKWNGEDLPHDDKAPPVTILPDGARHEFDPEQNYVSWMDFTFYVATGPAGISLHDVRFKGKRIIYELAMQEALAHYAGPDWEQTYASYLDVTIDFTNFNLIPGYDCPSYATYTNAFCLFEYPKDYPMNRHSSWEYYHATKNIAFLVRSVSTIGNYDYQTTYEFYHDGSIQVLVRASGYIQASDSINEPNADEYGFRIRDDLFGSMHDHVLNFKVDLDILGTDNTLLKTEFVPHSQVYDWSDGKTVNTMKAKRSFIKTENDGKINWAPNAAATYSVVNKDAPNEFGEFPGYKIYPSTGSPVHLTIQKSTVFGKLVDWASHHLYVLRRKDSEPVSAHPDARTWNLKSHVDFNRFFNGENLEQKDIVLYFNLGMHHMPDTYDLPVTVFQGAQAGITFRPQNYQRSDNSMSTKQQIRITEDNDEAVVETYGSQSLSGSFDLSSANPAWYPVPRYNDD
ncbi:Membrane primary amine oxidase [Paramyrothecium foliicola]|nr:Membrane primary amine oxidase [Paramyrothecium foliicola]